MRKLEFKYLDYLFEGMYEVESKRYPGSIFWKKDDDILIVLEKSGIMWVDNEILEDFSDTFSLGYDEAQQIIKEWLMKHLNLERITLFFGVTNSVGPLEEHLNFEKKII